MTLTSETEVVVCPSSIFLQGVKANLRSDVAVGAQDAWTQGNGAFTGETSADMVKDCGANWVVVGHSERRGKGGEARSLIRQALQRLVVASAQRNKAKRRSLPCSHNPAVFFPFFFFFSFCCYHSYLTLARSVLVAPPPSFPFPFPFPSSLLRVQRGSCQEGQVRSGQGTLRHCLLRRTPRGSRSRHHERFCVPSAEGLRRRI